MADPGFLRVATTLEGVRKPVIFPKKTAENCMKMKEFGPQGEGWGGGGARSLRSATDLKLVDNFKIEALV